MTTDAIRAAAVDAPLAHLIPDADRDEVDIDNWAKAILDVCTKGGLWADDSQVDVLLILRAGVIRGGAAKVRAGEILE